MSAQTTYSRPLFHQTLLLSSLQAQRVVERVFKRTVSALYGIDVVLRLTMQTEDIDSIEGIIGDKLHTMQQTLESELARLDAILKTEGILDTPVYSNAQSFEAKISSPHVGHFVKIIASLDQLMMKVDALWLLQKISNQQRANLASLWQKKTLALASQIIDIEIRGRKKVSQSEKIETEPEITQTLD